MKYTNLNKENFFNQLREKYPQAVDAFCKWIDEYKKEVGWDALFGNIFPTEQKIKFHDVPLELQMGIFSRFVSEMMVNENEWNAEAVKDNVAKEVQREFAAIELKLQIEQNAK